MWAGAVNSDALRRTESSMRAHQAHPQHDDQHLGGDGCFEQPEDSQQDLGAPGTSSDRNYAGTWGERDTGDITEREALREYEVLRQDLSQLHKTRTSETVQTGRSRTTGRSRRRGSRASRLQPSESHPQPDDSDIENDDEESDGDFELGDFMREGHFEKRTEEGSAKRVGVVYEHLTVKGVGSTATLVRTIPDAILGTFGPDLYRNLCRFFPSLRFRKPPTRDLIHDFTGCVRDGEMILVLGRPGAGCSTLLKAIANDREPFAAVLGDVSYGGIPAKDQNKRFRGEVTYNAEDDTHFAALSVWKTLRFALMNKTRRRDADDIPVIVEALMKIFGISHTKHTLVGDDLTRGVSGGERKRVSIAETLASKSSIVTWDNSTRGLDASTALDYAKSLRIMTDISNRTTFVTLYQAGEGIYEVMDKVLVIDDGRQIFSGPASRAKQYFVDLGFECPDRQTTADFLTAVTDPLERRFRPGFEHRTPKTSTELEKAFRESADYKALLEDVTDYKTHLERTNHEDTKRFVGAVEESKSKHVSDKSPYTVSFFRQVVACTKREAWLLFGDTRTLWTKLFIIVSNGLIVGSLFYGQPNDTAGAFSRTGTLFFSILFLGWLQMSELMKAVSGRAVVSRHRDYAFYRPSAVSLARVVLDFPIIAVQVAVFSTTMYFMTNLDVDVSKYWIYILFVYTTTIMITALYRMFASLSPEIDTAVRFSGISLNLLVIFTGYVIPRPQLLEKYIWFGWLYWVNPVSYSFEAVLTNEFTGRMMKCAEADLVPQGHGVDPKYQGCSVTGAVAGSTDVSGGRYLMTTYNFSRSTLWRNFGVVVAFAVLYIIITVIATEVVNFGAGQGGGSLVFKKSRKAKKMTQLATVDEEKGEGAALSSDSSARIQANQIQEKVDPGVESASTRIGDGQVTEGGAVGSGSSNTRIGDPPGSGSPGSQDDLSPDLMQRSDSKLPDANDEVLHQLAKSDSIFTWKDLEYTVPYLGGERKLLNKVSGYAKPGVMVALMGASGAGKSTLLNTLSQRQSIGVVSGEMLVDGRALNEDFQRNTGFCLQGDIHDRTQTVREALEFSAILRQDASISRTDKIEYVDKIIDLLELNDLQDAIIVSLGVEQRKRLTIGVELAAKPSLLLFLDEPTSGLDSQGAYSIVRFLRKLSQAGQAIICTIHQPSSMLIQQFDMVLALNPGGNTFYFGSMGEGGRDIIKYFADRGAVCPPEKNVAEFVLETAARPHRRPDGTKINWNREWRNSEEAQRVLEEIDGLKRTRSEATHGQDDAAHTEFAASTWLQSTELTKRIFRQYWRDPSYVYGKFFTAVIIGIFNGFTFFQLGHTIQDMQNRMFTCFLIITVPPTLVNSTLPRFYSNMGIWQAREYPSRIYGWFAFCTANILAEIPAAIVQAVLYWVLWYLPTGLPRQSSVSGYVFLMTMLIFLFMNSWGQWICSFAPTFTVISNVLPFFFVMFALFNGVVRPYSMLPVFWRYWMYWINPSTYWIGGILAATLDGAPVRCASSETARFNTPPGKTCQDYAGEFVRSAPGYLLNPNDTSDCQYCPLSSGNDYLRSLNITADEKWRDMGIFLAFCISNWALVYFFIYTVRVRGWSFGLASVFSGLGKAVDRAKGKGRRKGQ